MYIYRVEDRIGNGYIRAGFTPPRVDRAAGGLDGRADRVQV